VSSSINIRILREARKSRKLSVEEVAAFANVTEDRLRKFENAAASPTSNQLSKLGELYNLAFYQFYSESLPDFSEALPDFRKTNPTKANLSPRGLVRIWQTQSQAEFVEMMARALGALKPQRSTFLRLTNEKQPSAEALRNQFDLWNEKVAKGLKFSGTDEMKFSSYLRCFVEFHGCNTVFNSVPETDYLGFFDEYSESQKSIFVNRNQAYSKRKLFTLSHEVAHFLFDAEGVSNPFIAKNAIERQCNQYAAEFLAPEGLVRRIIDSKPKTRSSERLIDLVSGNSLLSRQASALRLFELDLISKSDTSSFFRKAASKRQFKEFEAKPKTAPMGRPAAVGKKLSEVGTYNCYVAKLAMEQKLVDPIDVARGLGISEGLQGDVFDLAARRYEASAD